MKILAIGDVHGEDIWKKFHDLKILSEIPNLQPSFDKYIFTGDYCDSYNRSNVEIFDNLQSLIQLKKNYPDNVELLLGNHDLNYYFTNDRHFMCSGYRPEAYYDLHDLFRNNADLFKPAFQIYNYIFTHAGIAMGWYHYSFKKYHNEFRNLADIINEEFILSQGKRHPIYDCGYARGGSSQVGGIFWADKTETWYKPIENYHQIVGHSRVDDIKYRRINKDTSVTYIDCLTGLINKVNKDQYNFENNTLNFNIHDYCFFLDI